MCNNIISFIYLFFQFFVPIGSNQQSANTLIKSQLETRTRKKNSCSRMTRIRFRFESLNLFGTIKPRPGDEQSLQICVRVLLPPGALLERLTLIFLKTTYRIHLPQTILYVTWFRTRIEIVVYYCAMQSKNVVIRIIVLLELICVKWTYKYFFVLFMQQNLDYSFKDKTHFYIHNYYVLILILYVLR